MSVRLVHDVSGHTTKVDSKITMKYLGYNVAQEDMQPCSVCAEAKVRQKNLPTRILSSQVIRMNVPIPSEVNGKVNLYISTVKALKGIKVTATRPQWRMLTDQRTQMKFSAFYQKKNDMVEHTCEIFKRWKQKGYSVRTIRCDNAGENIALEKKNSSAIWQLNIDFEYIARDTPQENSYAEVGFATIIKRGNAMMIAANLSLEKRYVFFREAMERATLLDGLVVTIIEGIKLTRVEHWSSSLPRWVSYLRTWGEAGVVKLNSKTTAKLVQNGVTCMCVGYTLSHEGNVYRMRDPNTRRIHVSCDIIWLKRMFFENNCPREKYTCKNLLTIEVGEIEVQDDRTSTSEQENNILEGSYENTGQNKNNISDGSYENTGRIANNISDGSYEDTDNPVSSGGTEREEITPTDNEDSSQEDRSSSTEIEESPARTTRARRATQHTSKGWYKDFAMLALTKSEIDYQNHLKEVAMSGMTHEDYKIHHEAVFVGVGLGGGFKNTAELKIMKYSETMRTDRIGWTKTVDEEYKRMINNKVWIPIKIVDVPMGAKVLTST